MPAVRPTRPAAAPPGQCAPTAASAARALAAQNVLRIGPHWIGLRAAGAGPTQSSARWPPSQKEHPRRRGADDELTAVDLFSGGASPRTRGGLVNQPGLGSGASPLARGRRSCRPPRPRSPGSILAGAGPTRASATTPRTKPEHPRGRGADLVGDFVPRQPEGASPRARGRPPSRPPGGPPLREHPRGRGADPPRRLEEGGQRGASPRARGRLLIRPHLGHVGRSIPAGAGPTPRRGSTRAATWEHPRGRGADNSTIQQPDDHLGASPRARGRLWALMVVGIIARSIPAGAGPTLTDLGVLGS